MANKDERRRKSLNNTQLKVISLQQVCFISMFIFNLIFN